MLKRILIILILFIPILSLADPLPADKAFNISVQKVDPNTIKIKWSIAPKYFLYKDCLQVINKDTEVLQIGDIKYPTPQMKTNRQGQLFPAYHAKLSLNIPIITDKPGESLIEVRYQGCSDEGFCYPPETRLIKIAFNPNLAITQVNLENPERIKVMPTKINPSIPEKVANSSDLTQLFASNNFIVIIFSFLGFGLLLAFTPCILPMVPVISGMIIGHGPSISTRKAFMLSLTYVLSMSITYGIIGAGIALLGSNLQVIMQSPIAIILFSIVFILLALSMFDIYEIKLPLGLQNKLANISRSQAGGHYLNAAILGAMSILILSPCVSPPLIGALSYIAQTGDVVLGLASLFFLSFGMGIPLLLIGTSAGKILPKAGAWMNTVKSLFGVIMLGVAIYLIARIIPPVFSMFLWASLCVFTGVFLRPFTNEKTTQERFKQGLGIILIGYGLFILYGASSGHTNPLLPLKNNCPSLTKFKTKTIIVKTLQETQDALRTAQDNQTPVVLYFYADWCSSCHVISSTILQNEAVLRELERIIMIKVDLTKNDAYSKELLNHYHVIAPPTFIFINKEGKTLPSPQLVGEVTANALLTQLMKL